MKAVVRKSSMSSMEFPHPAVPPDDTESTLESLCIDLCNLIVESRVPGANERGCGDGDHCPPVMGINEHVCNLSNVQCQENQILIHHLLKAVEKSNFEIDVLMLPDCCVIADLSENVKKKNFILLERWSMRLSPSSDHACIDNFQLARAVRSFLYFSQLSSWLCSTKGKSPSNIRYWVKQNTDISETKFLRDPELHSFPSCKVSDILSANIEVEYLPRMDYIPVVPCSQHLSLRTYQLNAMSEKKILCDEEVSEIELKSKCNNCDDKTSQCTNSDVAPLSVIIFPSRNFPQDSQIQKTKINREYSKCKRQMVNNLSTLSYISKDSDIASLMVLSKSKDKVLNCDKNLYSSHLKSSMKTELKQQKISSSFDSVSSNKVYCNENSNENVHYFNREAVNTCDFDGNILPMSKVHGYKTSNIYSRKRKYNCLSLDSTTEHSVKKTHLTRKCNFNDIPHNNQKNNSCKNTSNLCDFFPKIKKYNSKDNIIRCLNERYIKEKIEQNMNNLNLKEDISISAHKGKGHKIYSKKCLKQRICAMKYAHNIDESKSVPKYHDFLQKSFSSNLQCSKKNILSELFSSNTRKLKNIQSSPKNQNNRRNKTFLEKHANAKHFPKDMYFKTNRYIKKLLHLYKRNNSCLNRISNTSKYSEKFENTRNSILENLFKFSELSTLNKCNKLIYKPNSKLQENVAQAINELELKNKMLMYKISNLMFKHKRNLISPVEEYFQSSSLISENEIATNDMFGSSNEENMKLCNSNYDFSHNENIKSLFSCANLLLPQTKCSNISKIQNMLLPNSDERHHVTKNICNKNKVTTLSHQEFTMKPADHPSLEVGCSSSKILNKPQEFLRTFKPNFPKSKKFLLNFEESLLRGSFPTVNTVKGFHVEIGASGSFCPNHLTLPADVHFYELDSSQKSTAYLAQISMGSMEYYLPKKGAVQVTLFNPSETVVRMFVINFDLTNMPPMGHTFIRQKTYYLPIGSTTSYPTSQKWLRFIIHLKFAASRLGKVCLHNDIKIAVLNKSNDDAAAEHSQEPRELYSFITVPVDSTFTNF